MAAHLVVALLLALAATSSARELRRGVAENDGEGDLWALLIAGSAGWGNYRHQADIAHAYQVLRHGGVKEDKIITMMYDDLADNPENPHQGQLFNRPGGPDVYAGIPIDYSHTEVNAATFLAVLAGNASAAPLAGRHSSGRVIASGPTDKVFVYYADHGAPGILGMPSGPFLYADQLNAVVANKSAAGGFEEMVLYIEACESGSMFEGLLGGNLSVYATTAANARESSWGTYCPGMVPPPPPEFSTCLGDLYSVAWIENSEHADLNIETLKKQFQLVKQRVSQNYTYAQGSHVLRFGSMEIAEELAADFMGQDNTGDGSISAAVSAAAAGNGVDAGVGAGDAAWTPLGAVPQRDADLLHLWHKYSRAAEGAAKAAALRALNAEVSRRAEVDAGVRSAVQRLLARTNALALLQAKFGGQLAPEQARLLGSAIASNGLEASTDGLVELLVSEPLPRAEGTPLVDDWSCLRGMVAAWEGACGPLDQYGMRHTRAFANLCNTGLQPDTLGAMAAEGCSTGRASGSSGAAHLIGPDAHVASS